MIELTEDDVLARMREIKAGTLDPQVDAQRREELRAWRDKRLAAGEPLFPGIAAKRKERDAKLRPLFDAGADGIEKASDPNFRAWLDSQSLDPIDRKEKAVAAANAAWLATATNAKPSIVASRYDVLKSSLATEWNLPDSEDVTIYEGIRTKMREHDERRKQAEAAGAHAMQVALADRPMVEGWAEFAKQSGTPMLPAGRDMFEVYRQNHEKLMADRPFLQQVRGLFQSIADTGKLQESATGGQDKMTIVPGAERGTGLLVPPVKIDRPAVPSMPDDAKEAVIDWFADLPPEKQKIAVEMAAAYANTMGATGKDSVGGQFLEQLKRGSKDMLRWVEGGAGKMPTAGEAFYDKWLFGTRREQLRAMAPTKEQVEADPSKAKDPLWVALQEAEKQDRRLAAVGSLSKLLDQVDPSKPVSPWIPDWVENGIYDFGRSVPYAASGFIPHVGIPAIFAATKGMRQEEYIQRGIDPAMADKMSDVSAAIETPVEWLSNKMFLSKFKGLNKLVQKITKVDPALGKFKIGSAMAANVGGIWAQEMLEENIQDATPWVVQSMTGALGADVPEVDWKEVLHGDGGLLTGEYQSRLAGATLPMALLGGAIATVSGFNEGKAANERRQALMAMGLTDTEVTDILKISDPTKRAAAASARIAEVQEKFRELGTWVNTDRGSVTTPTTPMAANNESMAFAPGEREALAEYQDVLSGRVPTVGRDGDGWNVHLPDGTVVAAPTMEQAFTMANSWQRDDAMQREESNAAAIEALQRGGMEELAAWFEGDGSGGRTGNRIVFSDLAPTLESEMEAGNITLEQAKGRIAAAMVLDGQAGLTPATAFIDGVNDAEFRRGVWRDTSTIYRGGDITTVVEENSHGWWRWARNEGMYDLDDAEAWLRKIGGQTGDTYLGDTTGMSPADRELAIDEGLAAASVAWFSNKIHHSTMAPTGIRRVLAGMAEYIRDILGRAARLYKLERDGKLDGTWQEWLSRSVGLDDQLIADRLMDADRAEIIEGMMDPATEILQAAKGKLPHPDDIAANDPMAGDLRQLAGNFMRLTKRKDRMGRKLAALNKDGRQFFSKKGKGETDLDQIRMRLNEEFGFTFDTVAELFDAIDMSMRGVPSYPGGRDAFTDPAQSSLFSGGGRFSVSYSGADDQAPKSRAWRQRQAARAKLEQDRKERLKLSVAGKRRMEPAGGDRRDTTTLPDPLARKDRATGEALGIIGPALDRLAKVDPDMVQPVLEATLGIHDPMRVLDATSIQRHEPTAVGLARVLEWGGNVVKHMNVDPSVVLDAWMYLLGGDGFIKATEAEGVVRDFPRGDSSLLADVMMFAQNETIKTWNHMRRAASPKVEQIDQTADGVVWDELTQSFVGVRLKLAPDAILDMRDSWQHAEAIAWGRGSSPWAEIRIEEILTKGETFDAWKEAQSEANGIGAGGTRYSITLRDVSSLDGAKSVSAEFVNSPITNKDDGLVATVSSNAIGKMISQSATAKSISPELHAFAVANIDHLFEESILTHSGPDERSDSNIKAMHRYHAVFPYKGETILAKLTVKEFERASEGNRIYSVEAMDIVKPARNWVASISENRRNYTPHAGFEEKLSRKAAEINNQSSGPRFSLGRADKYMRRLVGSVEAKMAGDPQAKADAFAKLKDRLLALDFDWRARAARLGTANAGPADYDRESVLRAGREVQAILGVLPAEARYRVNVGTALGGVLGAESERGRVNALLRLVAEVDQVLEWHLRESYREALGTVLERADAKRTQNRRIEGKIGGEAHDFFEMANRVMGLPQEQIAIEAAAVEQEIIDTEDLDRRIQLTAELEILDTFGGLDAADTTAARLAGALAVAQEAYQHGRFTWGVVQAERAAKVASMQARIIQALGFPSWSGVDVNNSRVKRDGILTRLADGFYEGYAGLQMLVDHVKEIDPAGGDGVWQEIYDDVRRSKLEAETRMRKRREEWDSMLKGVFGTGVKNTVAMRRAMMKMATERSTEGQITVRPSHEVDQQPIPLDRVPGILNGTLMRGTYGGHELDAIRDAWDEYQAEARAIRKSGKTPRQRVLRWKLPVSGAPKNYFMTQWQAINVALLHRQRDLRPNLRRQGFDDVTIAQIHEFLTPEARQIMEWLAVQGDVNFPEINAIHRKVFGVGLPKIDNHWRATFDHGTQPTGGNDPFGDSAVIGGVSGAGRAGFARHRVKHNSNVRDVGANSVYFAHTDEMDHWMAYAEPMQIIGPALRSKAVVNSMNVALGETVTAAVVYRLTAQDASGTQTAGLRLAIDKFFGGLKGATALSMLGLKVQTALVQFTGAFAHLTSTELTIGEKLQGMLNCIFHPEIFRTVMATDTMKNRLKLGNNFAIRVAKMSAEANPGMLSDLGQVGMFYMPYFDSWGTAVSGMVAWQAGMKRAANLGLSGAKAEEYAADFLDRIIVEVAQPSNELGRSVVENQWNGDAVKWFAWAFASEARLRMSQRIHGARLLVTGKGKGRAAGGQTAAGVVILSLVGSALRQAMKEATTREDDDDDLWQDSKWWIYQAMTGDLAGLPILGNALDPIFAAATGQKSKSGGNPLLGTLGVGWNALAKEFGDEELTIEEHWETAEAIIKGVSVTHPSLAFFGQLVNLERTMRGAYSSASESGADADAQSALEKLGKEQREATRTRKADLDKAEKKLRALPEGERWKTLAAEYSGDRDTARELLSRLRTPALEPDEARLRKFAVDGGFRARAVVAVAKSRKLDGEAMAAWLGTLRAKRVVTPEMESDIQRELTDGN